VAHVPRWQVSCQRRIGTGAAAATKVAAPPNRRPLHSRCVFGAGRWGGRLPPRSRSGALGQIWSLTNQALPRCSRKVTLVLLVRHSMNTSRQAPHVFILLASAACVPPSFYGEGLVGAAMGLRKTTGVACLMKIRNGILILVAFALPAFAVDYALELKPGNTKLPGPWRTAAHCRGHLQSEARQHRVRS
jgi:hypothetical protein